MSEKKKYRDTQNAGMVKERAVHIPHEQVRHLEPTTIRSVESLYTVRRPEEVYQFLSDNPRLVDALLEAPQHIRKYFKDAELVLEMETDPEAERLIQMLFIYIQINIEPEDAIVKLHQLDNSWGMAIAGLANGKLCVHVEYQ